MEKCLLNHLLLQKDCSGGYKVETAAMRIVSTNLPFYPTGLAITHLCNSYLVDFKMNKLMICRLMATNPYSYSSPLNILGN